MRAEHVKVTTPSLQEKQTTALRERSERLKGDLHQLISDAQKKLISTSNTIDVSHTQKEFEAVTAGLLTLVETLPEEWTAEGFHEFEGNCIHIAAAAGVGSVEELQGLVHGQMRNLDRRYNQSGFAGYVKRLVTPLPETNNLGLPGMLVVEVLRRVQEDLVHTGATRH